jgi:hypothetical protein
MRIGVMAGYGSSNNMREIALDSKTSSYGGGGPLRLSQARSVDVFVYMT